MKEYALYKGDNILFIGTISEIANELGVKRETIAFYKTRSYYNRLKKQDRLSGNVRTLISLDE